ncbi:uncharacterized protein ColSpa_06072 [Colletotrichum spaethianum]|uniref:Heterokaryon incompatibility domain-containing protein n=1 Tax=Colletotrichum spaethianum TaxID=700344 RepID=A0AA37P6A0_9PEZI|nr:uncharacterized protein ColSpa_06072 [Colletotrichum spaethianum]GKT45891.1 hypothetical protein ColSpa_06072 [Colletotrichum spaethianum]
MSDWKLEALLMEKVYSNSFLNLSASHLGAEEDKPLYVPQPWDVFRPTKATVEVDGLSKSYWLVDGDLWSDEIEETPLMRRTWVFQERFLAPRVLHFGNRQLAWECNTLTALEMFPAGLPSVLLSQSKSEVLSALMKHKIPDKSDSRSFREAWNQVVSQYSRCNLTYKSDKLVAFSGVAKMVEARTGDEYLAGMWKSTLIYDLGWYRTGTDSETWPSSTTSYRAPSWSWMSVEGEIFLPSASENVIEHFATVLGHPTPDLVGSSVFHAKGRIDLECVTLRLNFIKWAGDTIAEFGVAGVRVIDDVVESGSHLDLEGSKEEVIRLTEQRGVYMVPLFATNLAIFAVMVSKEQAPGHYRRVGAAKIEFGRILLTPEQGIPEGWTQVGSSPYVVHSTISRLYITEPQRKEAQCVVRLI